MAVNQQVFTLLASFIGGSGLASNALYAFKGLGQMCVRMPELVARCRPLIERSLKAGGDLKLKKQALTNLNILLDDDGKRQRAAQQVNAPRSSPSKLAAPPLASAASIIETSAAVSGAVQQHLPGILASMLDGRDSTVRHTALSLTSAMLREGLAHPMACLPKVIALEIDVTGCAELAKAELRKHFERHKETLSNPGVAVNGALAAYELQQSLAPDARCLPAAAGSGPSRLPRPMFLFSLLGSNRKARHLLLKALLGKLEPGEELMKAARDKWGTIVERAEWLAHTLCEMPYEKEEDVLAVVYQINRQISLSAETTLKEAADAVGDVHSDPKPPAEVAAAAQGLSDEGLQHCHAAAMLSLTLMVKQHLKRQYQLTDAKCQLFDPNDTSRANERQVTRLGDGMLMDTAPLWALPPGAQGGEGGKSKGKGKVAAAAQDGESPTAAPPTAKVVMEQPAIAYLWLRALYGADEEDFDFNLLVAGPNKKEPSAKAPRKRKSEPKTTPKKPALKKKQKKKKKADTDDEDDEEEDDEDWDEA